MRMSCWCSFRSVYIGGRQSAGVVALQSERSNLMGQNPNGSMLLYPREAVERRRLRLIVVVLSQLSGLTEENADEWLTFKPNGSIRWMKTWTGRYCCKRAERWSRIESNCPVPVGSIQTRLDSAEENPNDCRWTSYPNQLESFRGKGHDAVWCCESDPEDTNTMDVLPVVPARATRQMRVEMSCCYPSGVEHSDRQAIK